MVINFSPDMIMITRAAAAKYPDNISRACASAEKKIRALPNFTEIVDTLIKAAVQDMIYDARHITTTRIKKETGAYGGGAKVASMDSERGAVAAESCYKYCIAGTILGLVYGNQLAGIAESETAVGNGHLFNAVLAKRLQSLVPADSQVMEAIPEKKLRRIIQSLQKKYHSGKEAA